MAASYGSVEVPTSNKKRLVTEENEDVIIVGELDSGKLTCYYLLLMLVSLIAPPMLPWLIISLYLTNKKWELYLTADGIYYTSAPLGCTKSWFIPLQNVKDILVKGSCIHVYPHVQDIKMTGVGPCYTHGSQGRYISIWYVRNTQRFVAAVKKQNKNITRNYHMETVCNF